MRPEFLDTAGPFPSLSEAQTAVDAWVAHYNCDRPHQGLDVTVPVTPADRFQPVPAEQRTAIELWLPPALTSVAVPILPATGPPRADVEPVEVRPAAVWSGGPIEFDRVVPACGNMIVCQRQFWMGTARAGMVARIWADCDLIHVLIGGARIKTVRSHLSITDLAALVAQGAVPAGPSPLPPIEDGDAVEVERTVNRTGSVSLGQHIVLAAEILGGRRVGIRIEPATLMFYDLGTRELLRTRANPLTPEQIMRLRGLRPAGPPPRPAVEPIRVQRRASNTGVIMVAGQKVSLGRLHQHRTVTVTVSDNTLAIDLGDGDVKVVRRTTSQPVRSIKGQRPRTAAQS
jgi:hypothetical protein